MTDSPVHQPPLVPCSATSDPITQRVTARIAGNFARWQDTQRRQLGKLYAALAFGLLAVLSSLLLVLF